MTTAPQLARINGTWRTWAVALTATLALNFALFSGIPHLMKPGEEITVSGPPLQQIQLTRLRRPEPEPPEEKPDPPEKKQPKETPPKELKQHRAAMKSLSMAIDINPRLPAIPGAPALPQVMSLRPGQPGSQRPVHPRGSGPAFNRALKDSPGLSLPGKDQGNSRMGLRGVHR